jgi:uncharacterized protein YbcI
MGTSEHPEAHSQERGAIASQVSREIVQLHANLFGRGPTKAKTYIHDDYLLCVLEDVFTPAERTLVGAGNAEQVRSTRRAFQSAVSEQVIEIVERACGRKVRGILSTVSVEPELSAELFMFETDAEAEAERGDSGDDG